jgi:hypothetical protein
MSGSRKPAKPVVVEAVDWTAVVRPDHGHVTFEQAVKALKRRRIQFDPRELCPEVLVDQGDGTFTLAETGGEGVVGWVLER